MPSASNSSTLRDAIQLATTVGSSTNNDVFLTGTGVFCVKTLAKVSKGLSGGQINSTYRILGSSSTLTSSQTITNTRIFQANVDGQSASSPGWVQDLTMNYTTGSSVDGGALLSIELGSGARTITLQNVKFTGTHSGWNGNGNLYMAMRTFAPASTFTANLTLTSVDVQITGQGNGFNNGLSTTGGSAFLHSWNNDGAVTITNSTFDESGFKSSFNFANFNDSMNAPRATARGNYTISGSIFKRSVEATRLVRSEGNMLISATASLSNNTFQDGSYLDLYGVVGSVTLTSNTFATIAGGYGIRVNGPVSGTPSLAGTNVFTGGGLALKYISASAGSTSLVASGVASFTINGVTGFKNLFAGGQADDTITGNATANWISGDTGNDSLTGGAGDDAFVFATALNASTNVDTINDFKAPSAGTDKIWLARSVFTGLTAGTSLDASDFGTAAAIGADVVYDSTSKGLFFKAGGGDDLSGYIQFATLGGTSTTSVVNGDFVLF